MQTLGSILWNLAKLTALKCSQSDHFSLLEKKGKPSSAFKSLAQRILRIINTTRSESSRNHPSDYRYNWIKSIMHSVISSPCDRKASLDQGQSMQQRGRILRGSLKWYQVRDWCGQPVSTFGHSWNSSSNLCGQVNRSDAVIIFLLILQSRDALKIKNENSGLVLYEANKNTSVGCFCRGWT